MKFDSTLPIRERILKRRRQKRLRMIISGLVIILITTLCISSIINITSKSIPNSTLNSVSPINSQQKTVQDEPVKTDLDKSIKLVPQGKSIENLEEELTSYINQFQGKYGIYYLNLSNADEFGINADDEYIAASTIKLPLNLFLFEKIAGGSVNYNGFMTYHKEDYEEGTGEIRYGEFEKNYTVKELSRLSIVNSDNVAANILFRLLGKQNLKDYMKEIGGTVVSDTENISCPKDMALYMKLTYEFCSSDLKLGKDFMDSLTNTQFEDRIPQLLPKDVKVAHKTGNQKEYVHDVGLVFANTPYILSVMAKSENDKEACEVIANISKKIYDYVKK